MTLRRSRPYWAGKKTGGDHPYDLVLAKAASLSYDVPSSTQQAKDRAKIDYLIANDLWYFDLFYYGKTEAGLLDFSTINWANPDNFQLNSLNPPTLVAGSGWKGNGTNQFWRTGYQTATHMVNVGPAQIVAGSKSFDVPSTFSVHHINYSAHNGDSTQQLIISNPSSGRVLPRLFRGGADIIIPQDEMNKHWIFRKVIDPVIANNFQFFADDVSKLTTGSTNVINNDREIVLLAYNNNGTISNWSPYGLEYMYLGNGDKAYLKETILYEIMNETYVP